MSNPHLSLHETGELKLGNTDFKDLELIHAIHDGKWDKMLRCWLYPFSCAKIARIKYIFPFVEIDRELVQLWKKETEKFKYLSELKQKKDIDFNIYGMKTSPFKHQKVGVKFMLILDSCMNLDELGNGKTWQALAVAIQRKLNNQVRRCLIICQASTKFSVWQNEIEKHTFENCVIIDGDINGRKELYSYYWDNDIFFLVINYELLRKDVSIFEMFSFEMVILDESVKIKNPKALQTKAVRRILAKYRIGLSGYPIGNNIEDIYSQIDWVKPGYLGRTFWGFLDRYTYRGFFNEIAGYKNLDELKKKIEPFFIRRLKKETLDLPPKIYETRDVELNAKERRAYDSMKKDMFVRISKMDEKDVIAYANEILTQMIRLSQIADGFITDPNFRNPEWFDSSKIKVLDEIVDEATTTGKLVLWSRFVPMVMKLKDRYNAPYISGHVPSQERAKNVEMFQNDPSIKIFVGQVQSGGMGITLHAASTEVFVDKAFISPSYIIQSEDRCHRIGMSDNPLTIISLIAKNTVDEKWDKLIIKKRSLSEQILGDTEKLSMDKNTLLDFLK